MELAIVDEKAYVLPEQLSPEQARERAWDEKVSVFGNLTKFIFRPKGEEIQIVYSEKRYEPFWHIVCRTEYIFGRRARFMVPVAGKEVRHVTLDGQEQEFAVNEKGQIALAGMEHCHDESTKEYFFDAVSGAQLPEWKRYLSYPREELADVTTFAPENAMVVAPEVRASFVVRQVLSDMMKAVQADVIHKDLVEVNSIDLYLKPVYAFEYHWAAKDKRAIVELDALTGEFRMGGKAMRSDLGKMLTPELLFDVGIDAVDLFVPGGGIALKVGRAFVKQQQSKS